MALQCVRHALHRLVCITSRAYYRLKCVRAFPSQHKQSANKLGPGACLHIHMRRRMRVLVLVHGSQAQTQTQAEPLALTQTQMQTETHPCARTCTCTLTRSQCVAHMHMHMPTFYRGPLRSIWLNVHVRVRAGEAGVAPACCPLEEAPAHRCLAGGLGQLGNRALQVRGVGPGLRRLRCRPASACRRLQVLPRMPVPIGH